MPHSNPIRTLRALLATAAMCALPATGHQATSAATRRAPAAWTSAVGNLGGAQWKAPGLMFVTAVPGRDQLIAGIGGQGLWTSDTGGAVWRRLDDPPSINNLPTQVLFDPHDPDVVWESGMYGEGVFKTTNGGRTFTVLAAPPADTITVDFSDPYRLTMAYAEHERTNTVTLSVSGGRSWRVLDTAPPGVSFESNPLIVGENTIVVGATGPVGRAGIYRTTDGGKTWLRVYGAAPGGYWPASLPCTTKDGSVYWTIPGRGLIRSADRGATWMALGGPAITVPVELPGGMLVVAGGKQLYASRTHGRTWGLFGPPIPFAPSGVAYNGVRHTLYVWQFPNIRSAAALLKWSMF